MTKDVTVREVGVFRQGSLFFWIRWLGRASWKK